MEDMALKRTLFGSRWRKHYLPLALVLVFTLYIGTVWLPEDASHCGYFGVPCLRADAPKEQAHLVDANNPAGGDQVSECPGQTFQVSRLLSHLNAALGRDLDILLQPYLSSWDELIRFMESLGPVVGLISHQVQNKASIIRKLALQDSQRGGEENRHGRTGETQGKSYESVRSMIRAELGWGLVNFHTQTTSGCRTLLRLHRALLWLQLFLSKVGEGPSASGELRDPSDLCREAYQRTLAHHHSWLAQQAAELAFMAMPEREALLQLVCVRRQEEAGPILNRVAKTIGEVYHRTQKAFEEHGMLDLP